MLIEEVLKVISNYPSSLDDEVISKIREIRFEISNFHKLRKDNLTWDNFQEQNFCSAKISLLLNNLRIYFDSLKVKGFNSVIDLLLTDSDSEIIQEEKEIPTQEIKVETLGITKVIQATEGKPGKVVIDWLSLGEVKVSVSEKITEEMVPKLILIPKGVDNLSIENHHKSIILNPHPDKLTLVSENNFEKFYNIDYWNKLTASLSKRDLSFNDLNSIFAHINKKVSLTDVIAGIDLGGTSKNLLTVGFSTKSGGIQFGSSKFSELFDSSNGFVNEKLSNLNKGSLDKLCNAIDELFDNLEKLLKKRKVNDVVLGIIGGVQLSSGFNMNYTVMQFLFYSIAKKLLNSNFNLFLVSESHTSLVDPTVNEFAIYQDFQITSLKRDGHSAKLTCGKSVDADLNAAYNMIRILKPQMSITLGSNTYNLKQKIV